MWNVVHEITFWFSPIFIRLPVWVVHLPPPRCTSLIIRSHISCLERTFGLRMLPPPFHFASLSLSLPLWISVREHILAQPTTPQTTKPTPQFFTRSFCLFRETLWSEVLWDRQAQHSFGRSWHTCVPKEFHYHVSSQMPVLSEKIAKHI